MKKLGKLSINPEKVMKNKELISLRGGYGAMNKCYCYCDDPETPQREEILCGPVIVGGSPSWSGCVQDCDNVYGPERVSAVAYTDINIYGN